jgi:hypothetical protein
MNTYIQTPHNQTQNAPLYNDLPIDEHSVRVKELVKYLICHEDQQLTHLAKTILEQGYTLSELSDATNQYLGIQNGHLAPKD